MIMSIISIASSSFIWISSLIYYSWLFKLLKIFLTWTLRTYPTSVWQFWTLGAWDLQKSTNESTLANSITQFKKDGRKYHFEGEKGFPNSMHGIGFQFFNLRWDYKYQVVHLRRKNVLYLDVEPVKVANASLRNYIAVRKTANMDK